MTKRVLPVGAEVQASGGVDFRVWAPRCKSVHAAVVGEGATLLRAEGNGYFSGHVASARAGTLYRYRLDGQGEYPDPASRFQPDGPHGPSRVVDAGAFAWTDGAWRGKSIAGQVIYEIHIGTFTREGTWRSAMGELGELASLGITLIEVMPIAEFPGRFGWGYDGVDLYAPTRLYGEPNDFRAFVDRAHALGLGVILDVVYNHLGPDGCYLGKFAAEYFTARYKNDWGAAINFDGPGAGPVREFFIANAGYWIDEFHLDGLRLDATQQIFDASPLNVMQEITLRVREAAKGRATVIVAENEPQLIKLARPVAQGGYGIDALWNDDFHHTAHVALTAHNEAYYTDYRGSPQEFISAVKRGFLYQGQRYGWQEQPRGSPSLDLPRNAFVLYIQNHDQVANSARGERAHRTTSPGRYRALTALLLLAPGTPMLFQGQEFAASSPFLYFADHEEHLAVAVRTGRAEFLTQFPSMATREIQELLADPGSLQTFERCKLDFGDRARHAGILALHRDLLRLRREDAVFAAQPVVDGAVLGAEAFVLRFFGTAGDDRLLLVNLGRDLLLDAAPEPLLAPSEGRPWQLVFSSEDPLYGGGGMAAVESDQGLHLPGHAAVALRAHA